MDCVKLYFKESLIGVLTNDIKNERYIFVKNKFFTNKYIQDIMGLKDSQEVYYSSNLFSFFLSFLKKYGNAENNDSYQELVRIANLNLDRNQFWVGV